MTLWLLFAALFAAPALVHAQAADVVRPEVLALVDHARNRAVPVTIYAAAAQSGRRLVPALLSHGYGAKGTDYSFIATHLATRGYYAVSIQHEVPGDEPLPTTGSPYQTRMPSWRRGVRNILFVIAELKKTRPDLDYARLLLIGHSQGGDTSMLFAREHPAMVEAVISLDNRRMPWPRASQPRLCSIRSSDQRADEGVLPTSEEQARFGMQIARLPATRHDDMWDGATAPQQGEILRLIDGFLGRR